MDCKEVIENVDKYFERRLTDIEVHSIRKHIEKCKACKEEYEEMSSLFSFLAENNTILPPHNFTEEVMSKVSSYEKIGVWRQRALSRWGASFIAAGILITVLNFTSAGYNVQELAGEAYESSIEINRKIVDPIAKASESLKNFKNYLSSELNINKN